MNEESKSDSLISVKNSDELSRKDVAVSTDIDSSGRLDDVQASPRSTSHYGANERTKKSSYRTRISNGYIQKVLSDQTQMLYIYERKFQSNISNSWKFTTNITVMITNEMFRAFKSYILSSEDDFEFQSASDETIELKDREPMFVLVDSSCVSDPSSRELLIDENVIKERVLRKHYNKNVQPIDMPSTSRDFRSNIPPLKFSTSTDEMLMMDINLQSENEIAVVENEDEEESIVISYLRNKDLHLGMEGTILSTTKKSSLLEDMPKMETIIEDERFNAFPLKIFSNLSSEHKKDEMKPG